MTIVLKVKKLMSNPLLSRRQMVIEVLHAGEANVPKNKLKEYLAKRIKCDEKQLVIYGLKTVFGGGRSHGFALCYDNEEYLLKYEPRFRLRKHKVLPVKESLRKSKKEMKMKIKKY